MLWLAGIVALVGSVPAEGIAAVDLQCEYRVDPLGIDASSPRLSWRVESAERGQRQSAYRILVASTPELLAQNQGDLWDSGKVDSDETAQVAYAGRPLASRAVCHWKVQAWDRDGRPAAWSAPATWTMGLLSESDWKSRWISARDPSPLWTRTDALHLPPARHYRKAFEAGPAVRRATVYATALGIYELHLNGQRVGDARFAPGWTDYRRRVYYQTYDVTSQVRAGQNALGAVLADGWYAGYVGYGLLVGYGPHKTGRNIYGKTPSLLVQLEIEYADGRRETIGTDATWKVTDTGPIREADLLMGQAYDARQELAGWASPGYDDASWSPAIPAEDNGSVRAPFHDAGGTREEEFGFVRPARLQAYPAQPVRAIEEIHPVAITSPAEGVTIANLGQNFAGTVRLKVRGPAGARVQLRYGEMLHPDGRLMTENLRRARATDSYILRGDPAGETWTPDFTFHGFQYVELTGYPGKPGADAVTGVVLHSDTPLASAFACSDPMVSRLFQNIVWTQRANFLELPTDCPQRDEREGWMGDAQIYVRAASYNADVAAFFTKWLDEVEEAQLPNGAFPDYCPWPFQHGKAYATAWTDAGIIVPWTIWKVYGDRRVIERHYGAIRRFMAWRAGCAQDDLGVADPNGNTWGDWLNLDEPTPLEYVDTAYLAYSAKLSAEMARAIGEEADAEAWEALFTRVKAAFGRKYLRPDGSLTVDTQSAYALALWMELIPDDLRTAAGNHLAAKIAAADNRMATGFLGTRPLLPMLSATGHHDLAVQLFQSREFPSWGFEVEQGATTIWERWDSYTRQDGFGRHNAAMNSFAHYSFGAVCEWMFRTLVGIDTETPGFGRLLIQPSPPAPGSNKKVAPIDWVRAHYDSRRGRIAVAWKLAEGRFACELTLPANTSATLRLPARDAATITESGRPLAEADGVRLLRMEGDRAVCELASGEYHFTSAW